MEYTTNEASTDDTRKHHVPLKTKQRREQDLFPTCFALLWIHVFSAVISVVEAVYATPLNHGDCQHFTILCVYFVRRRPSSSENFTAIININMTQRTCFWSSIKPLSTGDIYTWIVERISKDSNNLVENRLLLALHVPGCYNYLYQAKNVLSQNSRKNK